MPNGGGGGIVGLIGAIILVFFFAFVFLPALGKATNQDVTGYVVLLIIVLFVAIIGFFITLFSLGGHDGGQR